MQRSERVIPPGRPFAGPESATALTLRLARARGLSLSPGRRCGGCVDDMVSAGSQPQSRDLARDPQHPRLSRRDRCRWVSMPSPHRDGRISMIALSEDAASEIAPIAPG